MKVFSFKGSTVWCFRENLENNFRYKRVGESSYKLYSNEANNILLDRIPREFSNHDNVINIGK